MTPPERYIALFFDDVHDSVIQYGAMANLHQAGQAAKAMIAASIRPGDRIGIFTASGRPEVDFTSDTARLEQALDGLRPRPLTDTESVCPRLMDYQAYQMVEFDSPAAITSGRSAPSGLSGQSAPGGCPSSDAAAIAQARWLLQSVKARSYDMLSHMDRLLRRMAVIRGQRLIVLVSPGFYGLPVAEGLEEVTDEAVRDGVVINSLNAEGVAPPPPAPDPFFDDAVIEHNGMLVDLAASTGGQAFHNNNDYRAGFQQLTAPPAVTYALAFSPDHLKYDGSFHKLKVKLVNAPKLEVQARRGYLAPKRTEDAASAAREQLQEVVLSRQELQAIPVLVRTQFFKAGGGATLSVLTHVDIRGLHFRKAEGKNLDDLSVVTVIFDREGHCVGGEEKQVHLHLADSTFDKLNRSGFTVKSSFPVKPGVYDVRSVVQDSEPDRLSASNTSVEIPF